MPEVSNALRESMEKSPYAEKLGFRLLELSEGYSKVSVELAPHHANFLGAVDGGLIMSLADYAFACSCNTFGQKRVAIQFDTHCISASPMRGTLTAEGKTIHAGKTTALTEITVTSSNGKLIAKAMGLAITLSA
jgi:acyl-CoA thioesterase